jgi:hypothetical protein
MVENAILSPGPVQGPVSVFVEIQECVGRGVDLFRELRDIAANHIRKCIEFPKLAEEIRVRFHYIMSVGFLVARFARPRHKYPDTL